jgi:hypothetical protein
VAGSDPWDGASAFDMAVSIPGIERDVSQTNTTNVGDALGIGPLTGEGDAIQTEPIKLRVNPDGDYSLQCDTAVSVPPPAVAPKPVPTACCSRYRAMGTSRRDTP